MSVDMEFDRRVNELEIERLEKQNQLLDAEIEYKKVEIERLKRRH